MIGMDRSWKGGQARKRLGTERIDELSNNAVPAVELSGGPNPVKSLLELSPPDAGVLAALYIRYPEERFRYISQNPKVQREESKCKVFQICSPICHFPVRVIQKCFRYMAISYRYPAESHSIHRWQGWRGKYLGHQADFHL